MKMLMLSTVTAFFKKRAGAFFVMLAVLFGFMRSSEHYAFAVFFLTDPNGMLYLLVIWGCYALISIQFLLHTWTQPEYLFIYQTKLWSSLTRGKRFLFLAVGFLQPVLGYGIYLTVIAIQEKVTQQLLPLVPICIFLATAIALTAEWRIRHPKIFLNRKSSPLFTLPWKRPSWWLYWVFEWLFRERGITLLIGKTGAMLVATCTILYYSTDQYDLRMPAIGLSLAYLLNLGISIEYYHWESNLCLWARSLPVSRSRRFLNMAGFHALVILPETLMIVRNRILSIDEVFQLFLLGLSVLLTAHIYLYKKEGLAENAAQTFFFGFIALTLIILYKIPVMLIALLLFVFACLFYPKWYKV